MNFLNLLEILALVLGFRKVSGARSLPPICYFPSCEMIVTRKCAETLFSYIQNVNYLYSVCFIPTVRNIFQKIIVIIRFITMPTITIMSLIVLPDSD